MLPLLEPFYNLPEDTSEDSFLRLLWRRVSAELRVCTRCVVQHHKAKEFYKAEYWEDVVGPLLAILQVGLFAPTFKYLFAFICLTLSSSYKEQTIFLAEIDVQ